MRLVLTAILFLAVVAPAAGQKDMPGNVVTVCAGIVVDALRLSCYDDAARALGVPTARPEPVGSGRWQIRETKSKMDDSPTVIISLVADDAVGRPIGPPYHPVLFVRCAERTTSVILVTEAVIDEQSSTVMYRIDEAAAVTARWQRSSDYKNVGMWTGAESIPFLKRLLAAKSLVIRFQPHSDGPRTTSFKVEGIEEAIKPVRAACKW